MPIAFPPRSSALTQVPSQMPPEFRGSAWSKFSVQRPGRAVLRGSCLHCDQRQTLAQGHRSFGCRSEANAQPINFHSILQRSIRLIVEVSQSENLVGYKNFGPLSPLRLANDIHGNQRIDISPGCRVGYLKNFHYPLVGDEWMGQ